MSAIESVQEEVVVEQDAEVGGELVLAISQREAYERRLAEALALSAAEVKTVSGDIDLVTSNAVIGFRIVEPELPTIRAMPRVDAARVEGVRDAAWGLRWSVTQLSIAEPPPPPAFVADMALVRQRRGAGLKQLETYSIAGEIPEQIVKTIQTGLGNLDFIQDLLAIIATARAYPVVFTNRSLFDEQWLTESEALASRLADVVKPKGGLVEKLPPAEQKRRRDIVNRFWTLLLRDHAELVRVANFILTPEQAAEVPSLQSRKGLVKSKATKVVPPAPAT